MNVRILMCALLPLTASGQLLTYGVQGGVPTQTPLGRTDRTAFSFGPLVEFQLPYGLSLQTGLTYSRIGRGSDTYAFLFPENGVTLAFESWRGSALEVPVLAKYRFLSPRRGLRPFVSAGPTVRRTSITTDRFSSVLSGSPLTPGGFFDRKSKNVQWHLDPTFSAGVDFRSGRFHIEPQLRYSYWRAGKTSGLVKNQVDFLLGFRF